MAAVERPVVDVGIKPQPILQDVPKERQLEALMERLRSKATHFKSWTENAKALRMALVDKRNILDSNERVQLQKCLDSLQKSIKVTSLQSMVERLESISRQLGLKFTAGPTGTDCFISSDMFYVEVLLEASGTVKDVKIAHHGDPVSCPELSQVLSQGDFVELTRHLEGLSAIYQLNADKKQKSKAYMALQALETDLTMLSQLQSSINDPGNLVHKSPVGILETRRGGHPMKLTYFISPYDLLDLDSKTLIPLTVDAVIEKQLGYSVMVCIESSMAHKLQTQSLMSIARTTDGKSLPSFAAPSNLNSTTLPASFVLRLNSPMPIALALVRKIQAITHIDCADLSAHQPLLSLITRRASKGEIDSHSCGLFVTLPDQHHCYFMSGSSDLQGTMITSIPFTHPTHVPQILIFLRQQALFNVLVSSCIRPHSKQDLETALMFEISALSWLHTTVAFEHPIEESMATAEFDLSDITNVKCKLHTMPNDTPICTDEYASKVIQRCLSVPITMRALIRKAQGQQQQRFGQTNGDMSINLVSNDGCGGNLGHPSPFSDGGGSGGGGSASSSKFVTDFDVKLNGRNGGGVSDGMSDGAPILPKLEPGMSQSSGTPYSGVSAELGRGAAGSLDTASGFLDGGPSVAGGGAPLTLTHHHHHQHHHQNVSSSASNNTHGDLFSMPPERTGPLTNSTLLGNVLPQAGSQQQPPTHPSSSAKSSLSLTPPTLPQGKPNAMLMNLLNDIPQGQPLNVGSGVSITASPAAPPPTSSSSTPTFQGAAASAQNVKPRKQRKRKANADSSGPRGGGMASRSPKRKPSEEDGASKDLPTPDAENNDSTGEASFDVPASTPGGNFSLTTGGATITTTTTTVAGGVSSFSISGSAADIHALKSSIGDAAFNRFRKSPTAASGRAGSSEGGSSASSDVAGHHLTQIGSGFSSEIAVNRSLSGGILGDFRVKSEPADRDVDGHESRTPTGDGSKEGGREFTLDGGSFTISSGSSIKLSAAPHNASGSGGNSSSSLERPAKETSKKIKKLKLELGSIHKSGGPLSGGGAGGDRKDSKELEKIPIVLDITSACDSGKPSEVTVMRPPSSMDPPDRRPSVEIIPLGSGGGGSSTSTLGGSATVAMLHHHHHHTAGINLYNVVGTSIKISKSPAPLDAGGSKKDVKVKQREMRKMASAVAGDMFDKKTGLKLESRKERKRKRMEGMLEGIVSESLGGVRPPKIINVITPGATGGAGHSSLTVALDSKGVPVVSQQRGMGLSGMSRPNPATTQGGVHKSAPLLSPPINSTVGGLSLSKALTSMSSASSISSSPSSKKSLASSPTVSPTLTISPNNKSVSILKATHGASPSKPKLLSISKPAGSSTSSGSHKLSGGHGDSVGSGGPKPESTVGNARVTISPLKVHNKNRPGLPAQSNVKNVGRQSPLLPNQLMQQQGGQLTVGKLPTRPATVKLKQLNLPPLPASGGPVSAVSRSGGSSPTVSSKNISAASLAMAAATNLSNALCTMTQSSGGNSSGTLLASPTSLALTTASASSLSSSATTGLSLSPSSASKLQAMAQGNSSAATAAAVAALLAQKASKLAARSRKGSLSAVIDKLMASNMQLTGDVPLPPPATAEVPKRSDGMGGGVAEKTRADKRGDSLGNSFQKGPGEGRNPKSGGSGGGTGSSDSKSSSEGGKKAEFTVKQSLQGIKLTVTKTHTTEGVTKLSSSLKSSSGSGKLGRSLGGGSNSSKFIGSSTGLKPGVNSGPASKKGSTTPTPGVGSPILTTTTTTTTTTPTKSLSSSPVSVQSTKGLVVMSSSSLTKVSMSSTMSPHTSPLSLVAPPSSTVSTLPSPTAHTTSSSSVSKNPTTAHSASAATAKVHQSKHLANLDAKPPSSNSGAGNSGSSSSSKTQDKNLKTAGASGESPGRPATPKNVSGSVVGTPISSAMPPPPPPVAAQDQSMVGVASITAAGAAIRKSREDSPLRHSPVRQFSTSKTNPRDSPSADESDSERAFQRLVQAGGSPMAGSGTVARKPSPSGVDSNPTPVSSGGSGNGKPDAGIRPPPLPKTDARPDRSPKHVVGVTSSGGGGGGDGRSTPKSVQATGSDKSRAPSPSVSSHGGCAPAQFKVSHQASEGKRPVTPKLELTLPVAAPVAVAPKTDSTFGAVTGGTISTSSTELLLATLPCSSGSAPTTVLPSPTSKPMGTKTSSSGAGKPKAPTPLPPPPPSMYPGSPGPKEIHSPEDRLVIDYLPAPAGHRRSPDGKLVAKPIGQLPVSLASETPSGGVSNPAGKSMSGILGGGSLSAFSSFPASSAAVDMRMPPTSPAVIQSLKSPALPSPMVRSPTVVSTPQSEHSNPSSVAHSSPYDIDDELMDEALVGLGK